MRVQKAKEALSQSLTNAADFGANQQPRTSLTGRCSFPHVLFLDKSNSNPFTLGWLGPSGPFTLLHIRLSWDIIVSAKNLFLCTIPESTPPNTSDAERQVSIFKWT